MQDLIQMLKENEITNVISIDDGWSVAGNLIDRMKMQGLPEDITIKEYCDQYSFEIVPEEIPQYEDINHQFLRDIEALRERVPNTYTEICENLEIRIEGSLQNLQNVLKRINTMDKIELYFDVEFKSSYYEVEGNTLYILDNNMGIGKENEAVEYILDIIEKRKDYSDLIIIYSGEVQGILTHEKKLDYLNSCNVEREKLSILYQFWPLNKLTDEKQLISKLKEMLSKSMYGKALSKMVSHKQQAIDKAFVDLLQINIDNLDDMIIESCIEGEKITESYELLIDSLIRRSELQLMMSSDILTYEKGLLQYEEKRAKEILLENAVNNSAKYSKFRRNSHKKKVKGSVSKEVMLYNIADYGVNLEYSNPAMGDIYIFTDARDGKKYAGMLISQECSTMIRKGNYTDKPRRSTDELLLLIYEIRVITKLDIDDEMVKKLDSYIWPIKTDEEVCLLENTNKSTYVKAELLDLCGLNSDGSAKIAFDEKALEYKSVYAKEFYHDFRQLMEQEISDVIQQVKSNNKVNRQDANIRNMIVSLTYGVMYNGNFELQRVCRLDAKHSLHIIHEYLNGIGKIGLPIAPNY